MKDRYIGALVGLAVGDAVGAAVEFMPRGSFEPVTDMTGGGPHNLKPGQWTDDTSMALCLAMSLLGGDFSPRDQMVRYGEWLEKGYLSSTGECFDIGVTTTVSIRNFLKTETFGQLTSARFAGNGSLMRLVPVPMMYPEDATGTMSAMSSMTTHPHPICIDACRLFGGMLSMALWGGSKQEILDVDPLRSSAIALHEEIFKIYRCQGSFDENDISGSGYVVETLKAALWAFNETDNFKDGLLKVVNLGDDADTTGAVYGQIAGAHYGIDGIPSEWVDRLAVVPGISKISEIAEELFYMRKKPSW